MRSSIALVRCAVVRPDSPPPMGPSSTTITFLPALVSMYATDRPAIPAPTTQTSHCAFPLRDGKLGTSNVPIQTDAVSPPGLLLCSLMAVSRGMNGERPRTARGGPIFLVQVATT